MHTMATQVTYHQPEAAIKIAALQMNPHLREEETRFALIQWASTTPKDALTALAALPEDMRTAFMAQNAGRALYNFAPEETLALASNAPPGEFREELLRTGAIFYFESQETPDFRRTLDIASQLAPGKARRHFFGEAAGAWMKADPAAARQWMEQAADFPADLKHRLLNP
jgi:hypothetical protein